MTPSNHIADAHKLDADGKIQLFEISPSIGSGTIRLCQAADISWLGQLYTGAPLEMEGDSYSANGQSPQPGLVIGQEDIDLSVFKPLIWSGGLDNARIVRHKVLLDDALNNRNIKETSVFRVKRIEGYNTKQIKLTLGMFSPTGPSTLPFRQYLPPDFPFVVL